MKKLLLIGMFGYPGSGKTFFSERLTKEKGWMHLSSDRVRPMMFEKPTYTRPEHQVVGRFMDYLAKEFLVHGVSVVYDVNLNFRENRKRLRKLARQAGAEFKLVWMQTDEELALRRLEKHRSPKQGTKKDIYPAIPPEVFYELKAEMEHPAKSESVICIDGSQPFKKQLSSFLKQLKK